MSLRTEVSLINAEMATVRDVFSRTIAHIPSFDITNRDVLPYGLKAHTRSISWIVEQVITQQAKFHARQLGLETVAIDLPDTSLHDCVIHANNQRLYVNVKIHNAAGRDNKNDIAAVEKLYMQYTTNPDYRVTYAVFGVHFENLTIRFAPEAVHVFSPQFLPIYVNPRNDKIQALYRHEPIHRTRREFLRQLRDNSTSIVLR